MEYRQRPEFRDLSCLKCEAAYNAREQRRYPCQWCPWVRIGVPDDLSLLTWEVHELAMSLTGLDGAPPWEFAFKLLGIAVPSADA